MRHWQDYCHIQPLQQAHYRYGDSFYKHELIAYFLNAFPASFTQVVHFLLGCALRIFFAAAMILLPWDASLVLVIFAIVLLFR